MCRSFSVSNFLCKLCIALSNIEGKNFIWLSFAKGILNECGLAYIWNTQTFQNTEWLKLNIKQTQRDQFTQLWLKISCVVKFYRILSGHVL
jgi:hypothetical protein